MTPGSAPRSASVVIPAYNEAARIGDSLDAVERHLEARGAVWEVLVVDDGSTDATAEVVSGHGSEGVRLIRFAANRGKGAAVKAGVLESRYELVLLCDADLSTPIGELDRLVPYLESAPVVIGSRLRPGADIDRSLSRRAMSQVFNTMLHALGLGRGLLDTQCGFKVLDGDTARSLFRWVEIPGFAFDIELLELARHHGLEVAEVGVRWKASGESTVRPVRDALRMLRDALAVRRRLRRLPPRNRPG
jgi:dolichyl-phosphate beta-glucosyltransferase